MYIKKLLLLLLIVLFGFNSFGRDKTSYLEYKDQIRILLKEIDLLPDLFYVYLDQPLEINVYGEYNKTSGELKKTDNNAFIEIDYQFKQGLISYVTVKETKLNNRNEVKTYTKEFNIEYDKDKRIKSIESIKGPKGTFSFLYSNNSISVMFARKGKATSVEYIFSLDENKFSRKTASKEEIHDIEMITPGLEIKEIIETPMAQMLYNERILKYDDSSRLYFLLNIHYDVQQENILFKDKWGEMVTINYSDK